MKYAPKKVYVKENNNFIEITNEEHEARKAKDEQYAKRWFIPLQGFFLTKVVEFCQYKYLHFLEDFLL